MLRYALERRVGRSVPSEKMYSTRFCTRLYNVGVAVQIILGVLDLAYKSDTIHKKYYY